MFESQGELVEIVFEIHTGKPLTLGKKPVRSVARHRLWSGESVGVSHAAYGNWRMLWCGCKSNACNFLYPNVLLLPKTPRTSSNEKAHAVGWLCCISRPVRHEKWQECGSVNYSPLNLCRRTLDQDHGSSTAVAIPTTPPQQQQAADGSRIEPPSGTYELPMLRYS